MPIATFIPFSEYGRPNKCSGKIKNKFFEIKLFQFLKSFMKLLVFYLINHQFSGKYGKIYSCLDKNMK